jgi:hypothetical protein
MLKCSFSPAKSVGEGASIVFTATGFMNTKRNHVRRRPSQRLAEFVLPWIRQDVYGGQDKGIKSLCGGADGNCAVADTNNQSDEG